MQNIEAKFPLPDLAVARGRAESIGFEYIATLFQHDTFFVVSDGKLKLREQADGAWLIHYQRHREQGLEISNYEIIPVADPLKLRALLSAALGILGTTRKQRVLLRRTNLRFHLDEVANQGFFGELEAVLQAGEDPARPRNEISAILAVLQISPEQLISKSYFELPR
jgi:predicted adenylyl cyclase CyaB